MPVQTYKLQQYIGANWDALTGADRKHAKEIIRRAGSGNNKQLDLAHLPRENLEELFRHVWEVVHRGTGAEFRHNVMPKAELRKELRVPMNRTLNHGNVRPSLQTRTNLQHAHIQNRPHQQPRTNLPVPRPEQLEQVIMTADIFAIRDVFLKLCYSSPALARAAVRCLAPHSSFAQATLRRVAAAAPKLPPTPVVQPQVKHEQQVRELPGPPVHVHVKPEPRIPERRLHRSRPTFKMPEMPHLAKQEIDTRAPDTAPGMAAPHWLVGVKHEHTTSPLEDIQSPIRQPLRPKSANWQPTQNPGLSVSSAGQKRKAADSPKDSHTGILQPDWNLDFWLGHELDVDAVDPNEGDNCRYFKYACCQQPGTSQVCDNAVDLKRARWSTGGV